jgi:hypothetical protein
VGPKAVRGSAERLLRLAAVYNDDVVDDIVI